MTKDEFYRLRSEMGGHAKWGRVRDRSAATAPARRALWAKFENEADPDGTLPPEQRASMARHLWLLHQKRASLAAAKARTAKAEARRAGGGADARAS